VGGLRRRDDLARTVDLGGRDARDTLLATAIGVCLALGINQLLGLLWYEPRPFIIGLGYTLAVHAVENSFSSDHATFSLIVFQAGTQDLRKRMSKDVPRCHDWAA